MFKNYWKMAARNIGKNKLYAFINILGLAIGLTVYLFGGMLADYEKNHDVMFKNHERTYLVGSNLMPTANLAVNALDNTYSGIAVLIENNLTEAEHVARTIRSTFLLSHQDKHFHERISFTDASFTRIFDLQYIDGDERALDDPNGLILTRAKAEKIFGTTENLIGKAVAVNHDYTLYVAAVVENLPKNTHFNSSFLHSTTDIFGSLVALNRLNGWDLQGNWENISTGNQVYVMTKQAMDLNELNNKVNTIFDAHAPDHVKQDFIESLKLRPLKQANTAVWEMVGMPVIESVQILG